MDINFDPKDGLIVDPQIFFPAEIFDMVIGEFNEDKGTLNSCTMVNKSWNNASRPYLFRRVQIGLRKSAEICIPFSQLIQQASIAGYIRELRFYDGEPKPHKSYVA